MENKWIWKEGKKYSAPLPSPEDLRGINSQDPLLDIGCGYGRLLFHLEKMGFSNLWGIDFVEESVKHLKYKCIVAKAQALPLKNSYFKGSFLVGVLSNILDDKNRKEVFKEAFRVLNHGGKFFVSAFAINPFYKEKYEKGFREFGRYGIFRSNSGGVFRHVSRKEILNLLVGSGFKIIKLEKRPFTTMHGNRAEGFVALAIKE